MFYWMCCGGTFWQVVACSEKLRRVFAYSWAVVLLFQRALQGRVAEQSVLWEVFVLWSLYTVYLQPCYLRSLQSV